MRVGWGCLSGPGVCVILAVCQSGLGNGHQVITPSLTASSISLYCSCTPSTHTLIFFHPFLQMSQAKQKKKTIEWQDNTNQSRFLKSPSNSPVLMHSEGNYETDFLKERSLGFFDQVRKKFTYSLFRLDR